jgi:hypothetical protein
LKGTKIDVLLDPPQVCGSTDLQVGEFQVTIPGGVCPTDRATICPNGTFSAAASCVIARKASRLGGN